VADTSPEQKKEPWTPVRLVPRERYYFGRIAGLATLDLAASSALTCEQLGWNPTGPDLPTDPREMDYS
jgi:hypothetical protein